MPSESAENFLRFEKPAVLMLAARNFVGLLFVSAVVVGAMAGVMLMVYPMIVETVLYLTLQEGVLLGVSAALIIALAAYWYAKKFFESFRFSLGDGYSLSKKGPILPSYTLIPYNNVQDVHVTQGLFEKFFGLATIRIFTATFSGRGSDYIMGLRLENAEAVKALLFQRIEGVKKIVD